MTGTEFAVNCWERDYRDVLAPGFVASLAAEQEHAFDLVTILVNNVGDRAEAEALAADADVDRVVFVEDHIASALSTTGLTSRVLRRAGHFTDWPLVAVTLPGPERLVFWDAGVRLNELHDWVTPSLELMERRPEVMVANPAWVLPGQVDTLAAEEMSRDGYFSIGYGFSDQVWLVRRADLAKPVFRKIAPASWRYPMTGVAAVFEQRVDAYMRRSRRLRATYLAASYVHPDVAVGDSHSEATRLDRVRGRALRKLASVAERLPGQHPALHATPKRLDEDACVVVDHGGLDVASKH